MVIAQNLLKPEFLYQRFHIGSRRVGYALVAVRGRKGAPFDVFAGHRVVDDIALYDNENPGVVGFELGRKMPRPGPFFVCREPLDLAWFTECDLNGLWRGKVLF